MKLFPILIGGGIAYLIYRGASSIASSKGKTPQTPEQETETKIAKTNNLTAEVDIQVSGGFLGEKTVYSAEDIKNAIKPVLKTVREVICEDMPVLADTTAQVKVTNTDLGYTVRIDWPATFHNTIRGDVPPALRDCLYNGIKSRLDSRVLGRIKRFRVFRD
jgi:hypothetical protein